PLPGQDQCCGSAGVYNLTHPDFAFAILDGRMAEVAALPADLVLVNNPGCQLQLRLGAARTRQTPPPEVQHLAVYLYRAWIRARDG
ncbi:MAG: (Fe-S)-binding protein, partial [Firmicutes bacterium]|nr:(Fe-S)-binding protein [Bacillota bacterium]